MTKSRAGTDREGPAHSSREDWLDLAIRALVDNGIDEVKVQVLARKLNVSRSSFYWFFDSLKDLHDQLLDHWLKNNTGPIIERALRPSPDIMSAILNVFECWADESLFDPKLDMAIRLWARRSAPVRDIVQSADNRRLAALAAMFASHGYEARDAIVRARVLYFTQIGQYTLEVNESMAVRHANLVPYLRAFSGQEPDAGHVARFEAFLRKNRLLA